MLESCPDSTMPRYCLRGFRVCVILELSRQYSPAPLDQSAFLRVRVLMKAVGYFPCFENRDGRKV